MDSIEKYLELSRMYGTFAQSEELPLVLDPKELYAFAQKSGRKIGIVYESRYHLMVVDVVRAKNGSLFAYERLMNRVMRYGCYRSYYNGKYIYCSLISSCSPGNMLVSQEEVLKKISARECREKNYGKNLVCKQKMQEKFRKNCAGQWCNEFKGRCISGRVE